MNKMLGCISKWFIFPSSCRKHKCIFLSYCESLVEPENDQLPCNFYNSGFSTLSLQHRVLSEMPVLLAWHRLLQMFQLCECPVLFLKLPLHSSLFFLLGVSARCLGTLGSPSIIERKPLESWLEVQACEPGLCSSRLGSAQAGGSSPSRHR